MLFNEQSIGSPDVKEGENTKSELTWDGDDDDSPQDSEIQTSDGNHNISENTELEHMDIDTEASAPQLPRNIAAQLRSGFNNTTYWQPPTTQRQCLQPSGKTTTQHSIQKRNPAQRNLRITKKQSTHLKQKNGRKQWTLSTTC